MRGAGAALLMTVLFSQPPPTAPELTLIVPGRSIGGIVIGHPLRSVVSRLGPASATHPADGMTVHIFARYAIRVYAARETVRAISTTNSIFRTREGIGVGSSAGEITRVHGPQFATRDVEGIRGVAYDEPGIAFGIERQTVVVVFVYRR